MVQRYKNHLYTSDFFPPMTSNISSVNLKSGSKPRFPPGEDSKRKPKSTGKKERKGEGGRGREEGERKERGGGGEGKTKGKRED